MKLKLDIISGILRRSLALALVLVSLITSVSFTQISALATEITEPEQEESLTGTEPAEDYVPDVIYKGEWIIPADMANLIPDDEETIDTTADNTADNIIEDADQIDTENTEDEAIVPTSRQTVKAEIAEPVELDKLEETIKKLDEEMAEKKAEEEDLPTANPMAIREPAVKTRLGKALVKSADTKKTIADADIDTDTSVTADADTDADTYVTADIDIDTSVTTGADTDTDTPVTSDTDVDTETDTPASDNEELVDEELVDIVPEFDEYISLTGMLPDDCVIRAIPVTMTLDDYDVIAAYDITVYDSEGNKWQPEQGQKIEVEINNEAVFNRYGELEVLHIVDINDDPEIIATVDGGDKIEFDAESFSIYAVGDAKTITYEFYTDNTCSTQYIFKVDGTDGTIIETNIIKVKEGDTLVFPQQPSPPDGVSGTFRGWFYKEGTNEVEVVPGKVGAISEDVTRQLYPVFGETIYIVFHENKQKDSNNNDIWPVSETVKVRLGGTIDSAAYSPKIELDHYEFTGWSLSTADNRSIITTNTYSLDNGHTLTVGDDGTTISTTTNVHLYPVYKHVYYISFFTGQSGSGASFMSATSVEEGHALSEGEPKRADNTTINPTRTGYDFVGWCTKPLYSGETVSDEEKAELYCEHMWHNPEETDDCGHALIFNSADRVQDVTYPETQQHDWSTQNTLVNEDITLYAVWKPIETASYTVVIKVQSVNDEVGLPAAEKTYQVEGSYLVTGASTASDNVIEITRSDVIAHSADINIDLDVDGFVFARSDVSNVEPDGSTIVNVYFDRAVYSVVVKPGAQFPDKLETRYEPTDTPSGEVYTKEIVDGEEVYRELVRTFKGWSDGTRLAPPGSMTVWKTPITYVHDWDIVPAEGVDAYADRTGWMNYFNTSFSLSRPRVTAVYDWFYVDSGELYEGSDFYVKLESDVVETYTGLYEAPIGMSEDYTYFYQYGDLYYYDYNLDHNNTVTRRIVDPNKNMTYQVSETSIVSIGQDAYDYHSSLGFTGSKVTTSSSPIDSSVISSSSVPSLLTFKFSQLDTNTTKLEDRTYIKYVIETENLKVYYRYGTLWYDIMWPFNVLKERILEAKNLSDDGRTLTIFADSIVRAPIITTKYYKMTAPQPNSDGTYTPVTYNSYLSEVETKITNGQTGNYVDTGSSILEGFSGGSGSNGYVIVTGTTSGIGNYSLTRYSSKSSSGNYGVSFRNLTAFDEDSARFIGTSTNNYNLYTTSTYYYAGRGSVDYTINLLYTPVSANVIFISNGEELQGTSLTVPVDWAFNMFQNTSGTPLYNYYQLYNLDSDGYNLAGTRVLTPPENKVFGGWYYDAQCTQPFDLDKPVETSELRLYAKWDDPWYVFQVDPDGGVLDGGNSGSTYFWRQAGSTADKYESVRRDYVHAPSNLSSLAEGTKTYYYYNHQVDLSVNSNLERAVEINDATFSGSSPYHRRIAGYVERDEENGSYDATAKTYTVGGVTYYNIMQNESGSAPQLFVEERGKYQLDDWYLVDSSGNTTDTKYPFGDTIGGNIKVRAVWRNIGTYKVVYDLSSLTGADIYTVDDVLQTVYDSLDEELFVDTANVVVNRYVKDSNQLFLGWQIKGDNSGVLYQVGDLLPIDSDFAEKVKKDQSESYDYVFTLLPVTKLIQSFSLKYDANGGRGTLTDVKMEGERWVWDLTENTIHNIEKNHAVTLSSGQGFLPPSEHSDYVLAGWNTEADGSGDMYTPGQKLLIDEDTTLYAIWGEGKTVKLKLFNANAPSMQVSFTYQLGDEDEVTVQLSDSDIWNINVSASDVLDGKSLTVNMSTDLAVGETYEITTSSLGTPTIEGKRATVTSIDNGNIVFTLSTFPQINVVGKKYIRYSSSEGVFTGESDLYEAVALNVSDVTADTVYTTVNDDRTFVDNVYTVVSTEYNEETTKPVFGLAKIGSYVISDLKFNQTEMKWQYTAIDGTSGDVTPGSTVTLYFYDTEAVNIYYFKLDNGTYTEQDQFTTPDYPTQTSPLGVTAEQFTTAAALEGYYVGYVFGPKLKNTAGLSDAVSTLYVRKAEDGFEWGTDSTTMTNVGYDRAIYVIFEQSSPPPAPTGVSFNDNANGAALVAGIVLALTSVFFWYYTYLPDEEKRKKLA